MLQGYIKRIANASLQTVFFSVWNVAILYSFCIISFVLLNLLGLLADVCTSELAYPLFLGIFGHIWETISIPTMFYGNTFKKYSQQTNVFCIIEWCITSIAHNACTYDIILIYFVGILMATTRRHILSCIQCNIIRFLNVRTIDSNYKMICFRRRSIHCIWLPCTYVTVWVHFLNSLFKF